MGDLTEKDLLDHQEMDHSSKMMNTTKNTKEEDLDLKEKDLEDPEETNHLFKMMNTIITMNMMKNTEDHLEMDHSSRENLKNLKWKINLKENPKEKEDLKENPKEKENLKEKDL